MKADQVTLVAEGCLLVLINTIAILVIIKLTRTFNNILIGLLFLSHILTGVLNVFSVVFEHEGDLERHLFSVTILHFFSGMEVVYTVTISLERFMAIGKPFLYKRLSKIHGACVIAAAPLGAAVYITCLHFSTTAYMAGFGIVILGAVLVTVSNIHLYRSVKGQCRRIKSLTKGNSYIEETQKKASVTKRQLKSLKICLFISVSYLFTWVPLTAYLLLTKTVSGIVITLFPDVLAYSNGIWDVAIFFYLSKTARRHLNTMVKFNAVSTAKWKSSVRPCSSFFIEHQTNKQSLTTCP